MSTKYERTFVVAVPVSKAWTAFNDPGERDAWMGSLPEGFEPSEIRIGAVEPNRRLSWSQNQAPGLEGWYETSVTFEEESSGTRITIVRSGFGDSEAWRHYAGNTARGWDEMIHDLILYLETGVRGSRHLPFRCSLGATILECGRGVRITHVVPGSFAAKAGIQAGDLLLRLNGAAVLDRSDVCFIEREHRAGETIDTDYVRGNEVLSGRAPLSEPHYGSGRYVGHPGAYPKPSLMNA
jgi:uncharacterized protein YndB with AHSA1/START domain